MGSERYLSLSYFVHAIHPRDGVYSFGPVCDYPIRMMYVFTYGCVNYAVSVAYTFVHQKFSVIQNYWDFWETVHEFENSNILS